MSNLDRTLEAVDRGVNRLQIGCWTVFFNLFFAGFCLWGVYAAYTGWQLQTRGETTSGTVVMLDERSSGDGGCCTYVPIVEFEVSQETISFEGGTASYPPEYEVGEVVDVRYDPINPSTAQIDSYFERWAFPIIIIPAMTIAALVLNFFMFRAFRRGESIGD